MATDTKPKNLADDAGALLPGAALDSEDRPDPSVQAPEYQYVTEGFDPFGDSKKLQDWMKDKARQEQAANGKK